MGTKEGKLCQGGTKVIMQSILWGKQLKYIHDDIHELSGTNVCEINIPVIK